MTRNKRPPTAFEKNTVKSVELLIVSGFSLNRACATRRISPATYYRLGGRTWLDLTEVKTARAAIGLR